MCSKSPNQGNQTPMSSRREHKKKTQRLQVLKRINDKRESQINKEKEKENAGQVLGIKPKHQLAYKYAD